MTDDIVAFDEFLERWFSRNQAAAALQTAARTHAFQMGMWCDVDVSTNTSLFRIAFTDRRPRSPRLSALLYQERYFQILAALDLSTVQDLADEEQNLLALEAYLDRDDGDQRSNASAFVPNLDFGAPNQPQSVKLSVQTDLDAEAAEWKSTPFLSRTHLWEGTTELHSRLSTVARHAISVRAGLESALD